MNIKYVIPSYKRPSGINTIKYVRKSAVFVSNEEIELYRENNPEATFIPMPSDKQGHGKGVALNWVLDYAWDKDTDAVVVLDDDIEYLNIWRMDGNHIKVDEQGFYEIIENMVLLAKEFGCGMFGFSPSEDRLRHNPAEPFHLHKIAGGGVLGFVQNDGIRFDERFLVNEDIDIQLQSLKRYHKLLMADRYFPKLNQWTKSGGCQVIRTEGRETDKKYREILANKWGHDVITINKKQRKSVGFTLKLPLKGT